LLTAFFHCLSVKGRRHRGRRRECGHLRADAAAVSAIASGSQSTMSAISHLIARSLSVSAPTNSATYLIGAASVEPFASRLVLPIRGARPWPPIYPGDEPARKPRLACRGFRLVIFPSASSIARALPCAPEKSLPFAIEDLEGPLELIPDESSPERLKAYRRPEGAAFVNSSVDVGRIALKPCLA
jgi:hypothetical protein